ncbi:DUF202 domain-containing protein [Nakamurella sp. YIM 132087]|uniref:DUF202 domain-containing protein n=1 Tax=Nakamurella alba TaxID=2665158 RepID=A0A7K1FG08_9ACTN|nr:DUF202 domain-containing protein [Nakamurella alba]MTD13042.1 DUF202 domain-containing protein [Nakamurella alba]
MEPGAGQLPDRGAQNERTQLAWTRTAAALVVGLLLLSRLLLSRWVVAGLVFFVIGVGLLAVLAVGIRRRYAISRRALDRGTPHADGGLIAISAAVVVLLGVGELVHLALA